MRWNYYKCKDNNQLWSFSTNKQPYHISLD